MMTEKYRFNLELTKGAKDQLEDLQKRTEAASLTEVIRKALAVYDALQAHATDDWELVLRHKSKNIEKPVLIL
jgi:hypothetical protein